mmetsp:Transcript_134126/g.373821  ORF Transcript_134126/g.373821 Transcript_134126/m.373821 type:complete len:238 (+) Transcript_134126:146-859(+)
MTWRLSRRATGGRLAAAQCQRRRQWSRPKPPPRACFSPAALPVQRVAATVAGSRRRRALAAPRRARGTGRSPRTWWRPGARAGAPRRVASSAGRRRPLPPSRSPPQLAGGGSRLAGPGLQSPGAAVRGQSLDHAAKGARERCRCPSTRPPAPTHSPGGRSRRPWRACGGGRCRQSATRAPRRCLVRCPCWRCRRLTCACPRRGFSVQLAGRRLRMRLVAAAAASAGALHLPAEALRV